ncbi:MAG: arginine decarboxylase, partial [Akkermansia sp.]
MGIRKEGIKQKVRGWSYSDSSDLYGIDDWGNGYFRVHKSGVVTVRLDNGDEGKKDVSLEALVQGLVERGTNVPVLFRFRDLLRSRITELNESFRTAIKDADYQGKFQGVYPIKVNQQRQVVEEISEFGTRYDYGLEAGSKPELIVALAHMTNPNSYLICNGYKDDEFIDLALTAQKMGINVFIVLEMPSELDAILKRADKLKVRPNLGLRVRLATKG